MNNPNIILSHMVAASQNQVIGIKNKLPWHIPEDLKYFKNTTLGKSIIMGRKTFESLGKALPHRLNVVVTRNKSFQAPDTVVYESIEAAIEYCKKSMIIEKYGSEIFITGGGEIFKQTISFMNRLYITRIYKNYEGDSFYPEIPNVFKEVSRIDRKEPVPFSFLVFEK
ncbi:MAG: dihydrofolate reductase [Bdellovibrionales bacterium]